MNKNKISVILTGGTVCSCVNADGHRYSDATNVKIIETYKKCGSPFSEKAELRSIMPLDILSENMTLSSWDKLLDCFGNDVDFSDCRGIIVLHGTDTLAYTASLLSLALAGIGVPVIMVSSQLPLSYKNANGNANFKAAVELIMNGIEPNVYAVYKNSDGNIYLHYGAHLKQCANYSDDFFSADSVIVSSENAAAHGKKFQTNAKYFKKINSLASGVIKIEPYVGIDYSTFNLDGAKAIIHGTYHSETVCTSGESSSLLSLLKHCGKDIPVFLAPCSATAYKYVTTGEALAGGAIPISGTTAEAAYAKVLLGVSLGFDGEELTKFVNTSINNEEIF